MDNSDGARRAGRHLHRLLADLGSPARRRWEHRAVRRGRGPVNRSAVQQVLAEYLWDSGEHPDTDQELPRRLKDRVGRALSGRELSPRTLGWFVRAFELTDEQAEKLWRLLAGTRPAGRTATRRPGPGALGTAGHRTVAVHELHVVGADGLPAEHRTFQVVKALRDGVTHYRYRFDTDAASVVVKRGGTAGPVVELEDGLFAVDIAFHRPLHRGETASLEYLTCFDYRRAPPPELRRAMQRKVDSFELRVQFHPRKLPQAVTWAEWAGLTGPVTAERPVALDGDCATHTYLRGVGNTVVGYRWVW
jgi:hypothetical protein